jgi:uroporphyrinogen-III synthase
VVTPGDGPTGGPSAGASLAGVRVVVARPRDQAEAFVALLEAAGAEAIVVPLVEIVPAADPAEIDAALAEALRGADWAVVTSPNAASRVRDELANRPDVRVAAVGATTASALPRVDLVPEHQRAAALVEMFPDGPGRVVVCQAVGGAPTLTDGLRGKGWEVVRVDTHESVPRRPSAAEQLAVLRADVLALASGSQARSWVASFGEAAPPVVVAIGPQTADDAARAGLKVTAVATDHSLAGLMDVIRAVQGRQ